LKPKSDIPPSIAESTREERMRWLRIRFKCIGDCDSCGNCRVFRGKDAETALADYVDGRREFADAFDDFKAD